MDDGLLFSSKRAKSETRASQIKGAGAEKRAVGGNAGDKGCCLMQRANRASFLAVAI